MLSLEHACPFVNVCFGLQAMTSGFPKPFFAQSGCFGGAEIAKSGGSNFIYRGCLRLTAHQRIDQPPNKSSLNNVNDVWSKVCGSVGHVRMSGI